MASVESVANVEIALEKAETAREAKIKVPVKSVGYSALKSTKEK